MRVKSFFTYILMCTFFASTYLLPSVLSILKPVIIESMDPIIVQAPQTYTFESTPTLYVRHASLTISGGSVSWVHVSVYNNHTRAAARITVRVEMYDDANNVVWHGSADTTVPPRRIRTVDIQVIPSLSYLSIYRVRVRLTYQSDALLDVEPIETESLSGYSVARRIEVPT